MPSIVEDIVDKVEELRQKVVEYTNWHSELREAHHYDFAVTPTGLVEYFVLGLNPAETSEDHRLHPGKGHFNLYAKPPLSQSAKAWQTRSENLLGTKHLLYGDFFFWSSSDIGSSFVERFKTPLEDSVHLEFCKNMIGTLAAFYKPKALIIPGLKLATIVPSLYKVSRVESHPIRYRTRKGKDKHGRIEHYTDGVRPWLFFTHYSWLINPERDCVRSYLERVLKDYRSKGDQRLV
jgi:hypothetical protein